MNLRATRREHEKHKKYMSKPSGGEGEGVSRWKQRQAAKSMMYAMSSEGSGGSVAARRQHSIAAKYEPPTSNEWKGQAWGLASTKVGGKQNAKSTRFSGNGGSRSGGELYYGQKRQLSSDLPPEDPVSYLSRKPKPEKVRSVDRKQSVRPAFGSEHAGPEGSSTKRARDEDVAISGRAQNEVKSKKARRKPSSSSGSSSRSNNDGSESDSGSSSYSSYSYSSYSSYSSSNSNSSSSSSGRKSRSDIRKKRSAQSGSKTKKDGRKDRKRSSNISGSRSKS